jgi:murein L,D-transpeptidase YafK
MSNSIKSIRILSKEEVEKSNEKVNNWWNTLAWETKNKIFNFMGNFNIQRYCKHENIQNYKNDTGSVCRDCGLRFDTKK